MNPATTDDGFVNPCCDDQKMPSWSAFNSLVIAEHIEEQSVGFLPVVLRPVTDYATVFTAVDNLLDLLTQLDQTSLIVTSYDMQNQTIAYTGTHSRSVTMWIMGWIIHVRS